jgi:hypothetical protein
MITLYFGLFAAMLALLGYCLYQAIMIVVELTRWAFRKDQHNR